MEVREVIASSILSKQLAGGASVILLDVKVGSGAFMKELDDPAVGIELNARIGDRIEAGGVLGRVFAASRDAAARAERSVSGALRFSDDPVDPPPLVHETVGPGVRSEGSGPG